MRAASIATVATLSMAALALAACRGAGTTAADEPPRTVVVGQSPPATSAMPGGELGLGGIGEGDPATQKADAGQQPRPKFPQAPGTIALPELGAPCAPGATSPPAPRHVVAPDPCGTKGRIAIRWDPSSTVSAFTKGDVGCTMHDLDKPRSGTFVPEPKRACAKDGRLWAMISCTVCRMPYIGWSATAVIAEMTKEQALAIQERLGLPKAVPLTTTEAWSSAIATAAN